MPRSLFILTDSMLCHILHVQLNQIDEYLYSTSNVKMQEIVFQHPKKEKLRKIVILTYKIKFLRLVESLWKTYKKSGTDDLNIDPDIQTINRNIWHKEIQLLIQELRPLLFGTIRNDDLSSALIPSSRNSHTCLIFVDSCLHKLQSKLEQLQNMLKEEIVHCHRLDYNQEMKKDIHDFIEQDLQPIKIEIDCQIELIFYDYKNEIHQRELHREILVDHEQIGLVKQLCELRYKQEIIKSDIDLYRYMHSQLLFSSQDHLFKQTPLMNCTRNPNLRQELYEQYKIFQEKIHDNKLDTYIESLEMQQQSYENEFNSINREFQRIRTPMTLISIILEQRLSNITNQVACIHKYKKRFLQIQQT